MGEDDLEIIDPEGYRGGGKDEVFSHSQLIMMSLKKCIEAGSMEMKEGYYNKKMDKYGNILQIYIPDTRLTFIETVESVIMMMADDIEDDKEKKAENNIKKILKDLSEKEAAYKKLEEGEWKTANHDLKKSWYNEGKRYIPDVLTQFFPYYNYYIMDKVVAYRKIVAELTKLTKRCDYYREEFIEA